MQPLQDTSDAPEHSGMCGNGLLRAHSLLERGLDNDLYSASVYILLRDGRVVAKGAMGQAQPDQAADSTANMTTGFDMASLTKPITATLLLQCVERGDVHLGMTLADVLPDAREAPSARVTLRQLATHVSGLPPWKPLYKLEASALDQILETPLEAEAGTRYAYSDLGYILLGACVSEITGMSLDRLARERIFEPLGMEHTCFLPGSERVSTIASTAHCPWREGQVLNGEVHDANAHSMAGVSGHAGVFSTAPDMARFAVSLFHAEAAESLGLPAVVGPLAARLAANNQIDPAIGGHTIGWFAVPNGMLPRGDLFSQRTFGHTGFTGTMLLHDPDCGVTIVMLTNRVYSPDEGSQFLRLRRLYANAAAGAVL